MAPMMAIWWMIIASVGSWLIVATTWADVADEVGVGMAGPLLAAIGTRWLVVHSARTDPTKLTQVMLQAFLAKVLFFACFVVAAVRLLALEPLPFIGSFVTYFLALHLTEAVLLQRLTVARAAKDPHTA
jgi:hypothetical protein